MGFRTEWMNHEGYVSCLPEVVVVALDMIDALQPKSLLQIGVGNGGELQIFQRCFPDAKIVGVDSNPACGELGLPVLIGDHWDHRWLRRALADEWFDVIVDFGFSNVNAWPFLRPSGTLVWVDSKSTSDIVASLLVDEDTVLPTEEIMSVTVFPRVLIVNKRVPRVIPYMDIMVGTDSPIHSTEVMIKSGAKWLARE